MSECYFRCCWNATTPDGWFGSAGGRASFCARPKQLLDILAAKQLGRPINGIDISTLRFWSICEFRDTVLIGLVGTAHIPEAQDLSALNRNLAGNFFRLLKIERRLFERARRRRGGSGKSAALQVELERQRLGRELHTGVGQMLAAIRWQLELISAELPEPSENVKYALESISTLTDADPGAGPQHFPEAAST